MDKFSFKCKNCGHLESSGYAGERALPAACSICNRGVSFDPVTGVKQYHDDNWIVLADLDGDGLDEVINFHGITKSQIEKHTPAPSTVPVGREPQVIYVEATDTLGAEDNIS